jgi:hypothetical protein
MRRRLQRASPEGAGAVFVWSDGTHFKKAVLGFVGASTIGLGPLRVLAKSISLEARSGSVKSILNFGAAASEKQILCPSRDFTFSHSQGHLRKWRPLFAMSDLPPRADIMRTGKHVCFVPIICQQRTCIGRGGCQLYRLES